MTQDETLFSRLSGDSRLAALAADPRPAMAWRADGRVVVWSNTAGARLLGLALSDLAANGAAISAATLSPQVAEVARRLGRSPAIQLEKLRFPGPGRLEALPCACRRLTLDDGLAFVLVTAVAVPRWLRGPAGKPLPLEALLPAPSVDAPIAERPATAGPSGQAGPTVPDPTATWRWASEETEVSQIGTAAPPPPPARRHLPIRFVFLTDRTGRFISVSSELREAIGDGADRWLALTLDQLDAADPEAAAIIGQALERGEGFTRYGVTWPDTASQQLTPIDLNAIPIFDPARNVTGYRGFGVCRPPVPLSALAEPLDAPIEAATQPAPPPVPDDASEPVPETTASAPPAVETPDDEPAPPAAPDDDVIFVETAPPARGPTIVRFPEQRTETDPKVVELRGRPAAVERLSLSASERHAFREIARVLGARVEGDEAEPPATKPAAKEPSGADEAAWVRDAAEETKAPVDPIRAMREQLRQMPPPVDDFDETLPQAAPPAIPQPAPSSSLEAAFLDKLPVGLLVARGDQALFVNRTLLDLTGFADAAALERAGGLSRLFAGRSVPSLDGSAPLLLSTATGESLAVEGRLQTTRWAGEAALLMTFRKPIEEAAVARLRAAEGDAIAATRRADELQAVLDTATDGVVIVDGEGAIIGINRSAEALFGYEAGEVAGEPMLILVAPESQRSASDYLDGLRRNGVASVLNDGREITGRVRQGGRVPLYMTMGRLGEGDRFCAVLRDITQFKRAEQELVEAKRQAEEASSHKSDFLAKVSHEIRTPLNAIIGFAEVMIEERFGPIANERYRTYLRDIHGAGGHVMGLVNDLLDLAKIEAGKLELSFTAISVNDIVEQCVAIMQPQANRERIIIRTSLSRTLPNVVADGRTIRQVVLNLLSNSVKFTPKGGQVIVSTTLNDAGEAVLRVRDTGVGMSDKELSIAMEPFRQVSTSPTGGGTGLGLPLTKALVEANRAAFVIQSVKNSGTLVEVIFPPTRVLAE